MSAWLIAIVGLIYFFISMQELFKGNLGMFIVFLGYAFSNIGLYILAR